VLVLQHLPQCETPTSQQRRPAAQCWLRSGERSRTEGTRTTYDVSGSRGEEVPSQNSNPKFFCRDKQSQQASASPVEVDAARLSLSASFLDMSTDSLSSHLIHTYHIIILCIHSYKNIIHFPTISKHGDWRSILSGEEGVGVIFMDQDHMVRVELLGTHSYNFVHVAAVTAPDHGSQHICLRPKLIVRRQAVRY
jgi:hypothetical protein